MLSMFDKLIIHIKDIIWAKDFKFAIVEILKIINRRFHIFEMFDYGYSEQHLEKYMIPLFPLEVFARSMIYDINNP